MDVELADEQLRRLDDGRAFVEQTATPITIVSGSEARSWLGDLVTADVATLDAHTSRPSLLLTPTGRIRASFHVLGLGGRDLALAQSDDQPETVAEILAPYVLSSDVSIEPSRLRIFSLPGGSEAPSWAGGAWRPSVLGGGFDLLVGETDEAVEDLRHRLEADGLGPAGVDAAEIRRIRRGEPRFPSDVGPDGLPSEAGWEDRIDATKGCFLGQEAVARVRNLGHPTRVVLALRAPGIVETGDPVIAGGERAGAVTSSARLGDGSAVLARVRWDARDRLLQTASGVPLAHR
jgi:tRNA-modifying protein YgfZ